MNVLMYEWKIFGKEDIIYSFQKLGHSVHCITSDKISLREDGEFDAQFEKEITDNNYDLVFTINYSPLIAFNCNRHGIKYVSVIYDSPLVALYSYTITFPCNYIFIFDSALYNELHDGGITTVYYMPLAVNTDRLDSMQQTDYIKKLFKADVSFLGSMYTEKYTFFDRFKGLSDYTKGYIDAIMEAQLKVYGYYFIPDVLKKDILEDLYKSIPYKRNKDGIESQEYIYANYFIGRKLAELERFRLINSVSQKFSTCLYTHNETPMLPKVENRGSVDYYLNMPYVFRYSRINLNITLRTIRSGIPLRAMDIMGSEGFLLTNYQEDFLKHFIPDEDFVFYESQEDLIEKCRYYLEHESRRKEIAHNGYLKIKEYHNYPLRIAQILDIVKQPR